MEKNKYLPFYMAYFGNNPGIGKEETGEIRMYEEPMQQENPLEAELNRQEMEEALMQSFYPVEIQILQGIVEQVCDEEDYGGSRIYDEYPDKGMLEKLGKVIAGRARMELEDVYEESEEEAREASLSAADYGSFRLRPERRGRKRPGRNPLEDLSEILLLHEIRRRRCRNQRCRSY